MCPCLSSSFPWLLMIQTLQNVIICGTFFCGTLFIPWPCLLSVVLSQLDQSLEAAWKALMANENPRLKLCLLFFQLLLGFQSLWLVQVAVHKDWVKIAHLLTHFDIWDSFVWKGSLHCLSLVAPLKEQDGECSWKHSAWTAQLIDFFFYFRTDRTLFTLKGAPKLQEMSHRFLG